VIPAADNHNSAEAGLSTDFSLDTDYNQCLQHHYNMAADKIVQQVLVCMKWGKVHY